MKYYNLIQNTKNQAAVYSHIFDIKKVHNNFEDLGVIQDFFEDLEDGILAEGETLSIIVPESNFYTIYLISEVVSQCALRKINLQILYYLEDINEFKQQEFRFYQWRDEY